MYKLLLILKYLRKRRIAWVSLIAVMLCTAMVLVVISVMGGWLRMFRETSHSLSGDLIVSRSGLAGFGHYDEMIDAFEKLPEVEAAAPQIHTGAVINIWGQIPELVQVIGYDNRIAKVNGWVKSLHLQPDELQKMAATRPDPDDAEAIRQRAATFPSWDHKLYADSTYRQLFRQQFPKGKGDPAQYPGVIIGSGVISFKRDENNKLVRPDFLYDAWVHITVVPDVQDVEKGLENPIVIPAWIIDDSKTGVALVDQNTIYLPFDVLQKYLGMNAQPYTDANTGQQGITPATCNQIEIKLKDGFSPDAVQSKIETVVGQFIAKYPELGSGVNPITTETWEVRQADFLSAVEHEKVLLVILFAIISVVAVFLIFCIFFMIVVEKTRDIGIIKSLGATGPGVAGIFLGYGLTIGILGGGMGLLLGYLVIHNINTIHSWMAAKLGIKIWDAKTYLFDTIPNQMETSDVVIIVSVAILSSVLGAVVPAIRAARMNPVEALRWE